MQLCKMYSKRRIIQKRAGLAPLGTLLRRECESKLKGKDEYVTYDYEEVVEFPWAMMISCPDTSHKPFYICTECNNERSKMATRKQLLRYRYDYHRNSCNRCPSSNNALSQKAGIQRKPKWSREKKDQKI